MELQQSVSDTGVRVSNLLEVKSDDHVITTY